MNLVQINLPPSVDNNGVMTSSWKRRGAPAYALAVLLTAFYVMVYWFPEKLAWLTIVLEPLSQWMRSAPADHWFLYGTLYTVAVLVMGARMLYRYRGNRYQMWRTWSVMLFQLIAAYILPGVFLAIERQEFYLTYFWPLKPEYLLPGSIDVMFASGNAMLTFLGGWTLVMSVVAVPVLTYFFGKRWYCSWVCGCGGLAETLGDPFRQNGSYSMTSWKIERWMIHGVLALVVVLTAVLWWAHVDANSAVAPYAHAMWRGYGFVIGGLFSGVIGVGFYPLLGARVWCRFGCPMAAILGMLQKWFSRFRITTNGGQCISCGNCSAYCEMGIDVRSYAQRGLDIKRASCVGCGVCSSVCPRGVLRLENR
ncbi:MAG: 4Fe-4S binding protein [Candidatus Kapabacteria bacterium]|nr:4Fe-4S binding protein [Candidatus Kapabacteria bacterium]